MRTIAIFLLLWTIYGCNNSEPSTTPSPESSIYERLDQEAFIHRLDATQNPQLVDVRTPSEYAAGTIRDAKNCDFRSEDFKSRLARYDRAHPIFLFCQAGGRSQKAAALAQELGFREIYELEVGYGGYDE